MADQEKKELWIAWTHDALAAYTAPDDVDDSDELIDDMADTAAGYADAMLEEYEARFTGGTARGRRSKKKKARSKSKLDPDDDDDDD